jgi:hypothetical protein
MAAQSYDHENTIDESEIFDHQRLQENSKKLIYFSVWKVLYKMEKG